MEKVLIGPAECLSEILVFLLKRDVRDGSGVGADANREAGAIQAIEDMLSLES